MFILILQFLSSWTHYRLYILTVPVSSYKGTDYYHSSAETEKNPKLREMRWPRSHKSI